MKSKMAVLCLLFTIGSSYAGFVQMPQEAVLIKRLRTVGMSDFAQKTNIAALLAHQTVSSEVVREVVDISILMYITRNVVISPVCTKHGKRLALTALLSQPAHSTL